MRVVHYEVLIKWQKKEHFSLLGDKTGVKGKLLYYCLAAVNKIAFFEIVTNKARKARVSAHFRFVKGDTIDKKK